MYLFPGTERPFLKGLRSLSMYITALAWCLAFGEPVLLVCIGLSPAFFGNVALYNIECYNTILLC